MTTPIEVAFDIPIEATGHIRPSRPDIERRALKGWILSQQSSNGTFPGNWNAMMAGTGTFFPVDPLEVSGAWGEVNLTFLAVGNYETEINYWVTQVFLEIDVSDMEEAEDLRLFTYIDAYFQSFAGAKGINVYAVQFEPPVDIGDWLTLDWLTENNPLATVEMYEFESEVEFTVDQEALQEAIANGNGILRLALVHTANAEGWPPVNTASATIIMNLDPERER